MSDPYRTEADRTPAEPRANEPTRIHIELFFGEDSGGPARGLYASLPEVEVERATMTIGTGRSLMEIRGSQEAVLEALVAELRLLLRTHR